MMLRMSCPQIFDMEGFLREYREGTRRSRSLSEFSVPPLRVKDARMLLRHNSVAMKISSATNFPYLSSMH